MKNYYNNILSNLDENKSISVCTPEKCLKYNNEMFWQDVTNLKDHTFSESPLFPPIFSNSLFALKFLFLNFIFLFLMNYFSLYIVLSFLFHLFLSSDFI